MCQTIKYHKSTECPQVSSGSEDNNNKSKSTHESVAKNKSKSEQKGFKIRRKENWTDHIVNKSFIFSDFKRCENGVIKSADKNEFADIVIDGKRNLLLRADATGDVLKLADVVAAKDISENLLSLRKLADAVFSIYLDDESLRVYNKVKNKTIFERTYEKPNWVVSLEFIE